MQQGAAASPARSLLNLVQVLTHTAQHCAGSGHACPPSARGRQKSTAAAGGSAAARTHARAAAAAAAAALRCLMACHRQERGGGVGGLRPAPLWPATVAGLWAALGRAPTCMCANTGRVPGQLLALCRCFAGCSSCRGTQRGGREPAGFNCRRDPLLFTRRKGADTHGATAASLHVVRCSQGPAKRCRAGPNCLAASRPPARVGSCLTCVGSSRHARGGGTGLKDRRNTARAPQAWGSWRQRRPPQNAHTTNCWLKPPTRRLVTDPGAVGAVQCQGQRAEDSREGSRSVKQGWQAGRSSGKAEEIRDVRRAAWRALQAAPGGGA